jgi:uncharacterized protein (DUF1684 family)
LKEGVNTVGGSPRNDIILPEGKTPFSLGTISFRRQSQTAPLEIRFVAQREGEVKHGDSAVTAINLQLDEAADGPTILTCGTISFYVIKRGDAFAVRVKDAENPARVNFKGLRYFPIDIRWRLDARFDRYDPPHVLKVASVVNTVEDYPCPGALVFEFERKTYRLDAAIEPGAEDRLFIMFNDLTSGKETYVGGRQLYAARPDSAGHVVLDFNMAYNWPCVFTEYATCPIPPPQNRLPFRIEAGEKMYEGHE